MELHWGTSFEPLSQHHCFSSSSNPTKLLRWRQACNSHVACASRCKVSEQSPASTTFVSHTSRLNRAGPSTQLYIKPTSVDPASNSCQHGRRTHDMGHCRGGERSHARRELTAVAVLFLVVFAAGHGLVGPACGDREPIWQSLFASVRHIRATAGRGSGS